MLLYKADYLLVTLRTQVQCGTGPEDDVHRDFELLFGRFIIEDLLDALEVLLLHQLLDARDEVGPFGNSVSKQQRTLLLVFEFFGYAHRRRRTQVTEALRAAGGHSR